MRASNLRLLDWLICQGFRRKDFILLLGQLDKDHSDIVEIIISKKS